MLLNNEILTKYITEYQPTDTFHDWIWTEFAEKADTIPFLKQHRDYIEKNQLGFGDRAFHYMWYLLLQEVSTRVSKPRLLEIGVYKGQVISLWALIAKELHIKIDISAVSPLEGNFLNFRLRILNKLRDWLSQKHQLLMKVGNTYEFADYEAIIQRLFRQFDLDYLTVMMHKNYSTDEDLLEKIQSESFDIIYIDGDHSFEVATADIRNFAPKVTENGFLVMDDASNYLPGTKFWKGHPTVSEACKIIESFGFENILNIGHNRVFQKSGK